MIKLLQNSPLINYKRLIHYVCASSFATSPLEEGVVAAWRAPAVGVMRVPFGWVVTGPAPLAVAGGAAVSTETIVGMGACVTIGVVLGMWAWAGVRTGAWRSVGLGGDVADLQGWIAAASLASSILIKPLHGVPVGTPVTDGDSHTGFNCSLHLSQVATITASHGEALASLGQFNGEGAWEVEGNLSVEWLLCVDCILASWTIGLWVILMCDLEDTTASITVVVVALIGWGVALVRS